jgi:hypothetical protein
MIVAHRRKESTMDAAENASERFFKTHVLGEAHG